MGLFDMFKSDQGTTMTPHLGFITLMWAIMSSDGEIDAEEVGQLLSIIGGTDDGTGTIVIGGQARKLLEAAQKNVRIKSLPQLLKEITPLLTDAQKMCILVNMVDSSLSDGVPEAEEQAIIGQVMQAFVISEDRFRPFFECIAFKNDRTVFTNQAHAKNVPGYMVKLPR